MYPEPEDIQRRRVPGMRPWTREQFASHLQVFPEGPIGIEYGGELVASSSSLLLDFGMYERQHTWAKASTRIPASRSSG